MRNEQGNSDCEARPDDRWTGAIAAFNKEAERLRLLYYQTSNPLFVWAVLRSHSSYFGLTKAASVPLPGWVCAYLGEAAQHMWDWAEGRDFTAHVRTIGSATPAVRAKAYQVVMTTRTADKGNGTTRAGKILGFSRSGKNIFAEFNKYQRAKSAADLYAALRSAGQTEESAIEAVAKGLGYDVAKVKRYLQIATGDAMEGNVKSKPAW